MSSHYQCAAAGCPSGPWLCITRSSRLYLSFVLDRQRLAAVTEHPSAGTTSRPRTKMSGITAFAVLGSVTGERCVALQWCRLDRNVPYILSNLFVGQQKSNRFRRYDAWKSALVHYWSTGGKLCHDHCQSRFFFHEHSRLH